MSSIKAILTEFVFGNNKQTVPTEYIVNIASTIDNNESCDDSNTNTNINVSTEPAITLSTYSTNSELVFIEHDENVEDDIDTEPYLPSYEKYSCDFENKEIKTEPILSLKSEQYTVYPIRFQKIWDNYKDQLKNYWTVEEVDLAKDVNDWNKLSNDDRNFIMHVLAFFASADGIVNANIKENLIDVVKIKEAECAYGFQYNMENSHGEMYSLMLTTFVKDDVMRNKLINSIKTMPSIKEG